MATAVHRGPPVHRGGRSGGGRSAGGRRRGRGRARAGSAAHAAGRGGAAADGDRELTCRDCSASFLFTARAQALHAEQGFGDPVRCQKCRKAKRERNEANAAAAASGSGQAAGGGLTYEEKRVLGKNRKERRQEAAAAREGDPGAQPSSFRKGMDPQEARLLRLAREGKMKRAMHRPDERANFNTVSERLEKQGAAATASTPSESTAAKPIQRRIRDLERRLARGNMPEGLKAAKLREIEELKRQGAVEKARNAEEKIQRRYKMVKFFEERKLIRRLKSTAKKLAQATEAEERRALEASTAQLKEDLEYVTNYPRGRKYLSLFPKLKEGEVIDEATRTMQDSIRAEIKETIRSGGGETQRAAAARAEAARAAEKAAEEEDRQASAELAGTDLAGDDFFAPVQEEQAERSSEDDEGSDGESSSSESSSESNSTDDGEAAAERQRLLSLAKELAVQQQQQQQRRQEEGEEGEEGQEEAVSVQPRKKKRRRR